MSHTLTTFVSTQDESTWFLYFRIQREGLDRKPRNSLKIALLVQQTEFTTPSSDRIIVEYKISIKKLFIKIFSRVF